MVLVELNFFFWYYYLNLGLCLSLCLVGVFDYFVVFLVVKELGRMDKDKICYFYMVCVVIEINGKKDNELVILNYDLYSNVG